VYDLLGENIPEVLDGDLATAAQELDYLGINYYSRNLVSARENISPVPGSEYTEMGWEVCAPALRRMLNKIQKEYRVPPIYITENGAAFKDERGEDGKIHDKRRLEYLRNHFLQTRLAMDDGVDVRGYFVWSLMDNFEWAHGTSKRFGLIHVDYENQERTMKESGEWYREAIAANAIEADEAIS
jgi:beta-glucosidase